MTEQKKSTGMLLDGVFASEAIDSSAEIVSIKGMDISTLESGEGVANYEHISGDDGKGYGQEIVGRIVKAHKVLKESDCEDDRQRYYWKLTRGIPFLYGVVRLADGAGHDGARALAANIRDHAANNESILVRFSIEGTTTKKNGNNVEESIAKRVALTWKPCNKTCLSGVISDPNAPEGFGKAEGEDPEFARLGGSQEIECNPILEAEGDASMRILENFATLRTIRKTLTAGCGDAAPSSLTGGVALGKEDIEKKVINQVKAMIRDYGSMREFKRSEFVAFAKSKLPEVSDEFVEHFADLAETVHMKGKLTKAEKPAAPKAKKVAAPKVKKEKAPKIPKAKKPKRPKVYTRLGEPVSPNPDIEGQRLVVDSEKGIVHSSIGSFPLFHPDHVGMMKEHDEILNNPEVTRTFFEHVVPNWARVHKLWKEGKLPEEVVMHAINLSQESPTVPVSIMELTAGRIADISERLGIDPRHPDFGRRARPLLDEEDTTAYPRQSREYFEQALGAHVKVRERGTPGSKNYVPERRIIGVERGPSGEKLGIPTPTGRYPGELMPIPFKNALLGGNGETPRLGNYHLMHDKMVDLVRRHKGDARGALREMAEHKKAHDAWNTKRAAALVSGKPDPGEFQGLPMFGLDQKTNRFGMVLMGAGDLEVPDTHHIRYSLGLDLDKDKDSIDHLKNAFWNGMNEDAQEAVEDWHFKHDPVVKHLLNHPKTKDLFKDNPRQALALAFWLRWNTIRPMELRQGKGNRGFNENSTHGIYWDLINPFVKSGVEDIDHTIPHRTALLHQQYIKDYGEVPAMMMYYAHIVPKLLEAAEHRNKHSKGMEFLAKARQIESEMIELRKAVSDTLEGAHPDIPEVYSLHMHSKGDIHPAGRFMIHNGQLHHLEDYHHILNSFLPEGPIDAKTVSRLHGLKTAPRFLVEEDKLPNAKKDSEVKLPEVSASAEELPIQRPEIYEYHRPGMTGHHTVEVNHQGIALDGQGLSPDEASLILHNVSSGLGKLRYKDGTVQKSAVLEWFEEDLQKAVMEPDDALQAVRKAVASGHLHPDVERALTAHIFEDKMVGGIGNKYAHDRFRQKNMPGIYVSMDGNGFKHINDTFGHSTGDQAITAMGGALRDASAATGNGKLFRNGGDEFVAHFPSYEHAIRFVREAQNKMDAIPHINGTHKMSMSFGLGHNGEIADQALYAAKKQRYDEQGERLNPPGQEPHFTESLVPETKAPR